MGGRRRWVLALLRRSFSSGGKRLFECLDVLIGYFIQFSRFCVSYFLGRYREVPAVYGVGPLRRISCQKKPKPKYFLILNFAQVSGVESRG